MPDTEMRVRRSRRRFFEPLPTDLPDDVPVLAVEPAETDLGPLTPLVSREGLTDIFVNGPTMSGTRPPVPCTGLPLPSPTTKPSGHLPPG